MFVDFLGDTIDNQAVYKLVIERGKVCAKRKVHINVGRYILMLILMRRLCVGTIDIIHGITPQALQASPGNKNGVIDDNHQASNWQRY